LIEISRKDNGEICEYGNKLISRQFAVHCQAWLDPRNQELISEPKEQTDLAAWNRTTICVRMRASFFWFLPLVVQSLLMIL